MDGIIIQQDVVYKTEKGTPVTDSLKVAQVFGKQHRNVLQSIRNLIATAENSAVRKWFCESRYYNEQNKPQPMFIMTRDGFSLLAMGLTGAKAMQFKVAFIEQFNAMEKVVRQAAQPTTTPAIPQSFAEALRLAAAQAEQIERQQKQIEADAPRVLFSQAVETAKQSVLIGELAKIICQNGVQTGEKRLFAWMRENGYLCQHGERYNQPTQKAMEMGLFEIKKTTIQKPNGDTLISNTTKVTGKGQVYFVNKFLHNHQKNLQP
jgi:anti-repressor protein